MVSFEPPGPEHYYHHDSMLTEEILANTQYVVSKIYMTVLFKLAIGT